jgi:phosphate transport system permease protein
MSLYRPDLGGSLHRDGAVAVAVAGTFAGGRKRDVRGRAFEVALLLTLLVALGILVALIAQVSITGWHVFTDRGASFLTNGQSTLAERAGLWQGIAGSAYLMVFVILFAFPLGVGAAVYLEEYARDTRTTRFLNANIRNLAGVPSIVYGLLGLAIFVYALRGITGAGGQPGLSVISGGLTLSVLVLPIVIITTAEALRAVPRNIREAGYAVGATRWEVIRSHVLPYAAPGIFTGTILAMARAIGETAPILLVGAQTGFFVVAGGGLLHSLRGAYTSIPTVIFDWTGRPQHEFHDLAAAAIMVLMGVILVVNTLAIVLRNRYERRW